jgi:hypothetical protein
MTKSTVYGTDTNISYTNNTKYPQQTFQQGYAQQQANFNRNNTTPQNNMNPTSNGSQFHSPTMANNRWSSQASIPNTNVQSPPGGRPGAAPTQPTMAQPSSGVTSVAKPTIPTSPLPVVPTATTAAIQTMQSTAPVPASQITIPSSPIQNQIPRQQQLYQSLQNGNVPKPQVSPPFNTTVAVSPARVSTPNVQQINLKATDTFVPITLDCVLIAKDRFSVGSCLDSAVTQLLQSFPGALYGTFQYYINH